MNKGTELYDEIKLTLAVAREYIAALEAENDRLRRELDEATASVDD